MTPPSSLLEQWLLLVWSQFCNQLRSWALLRCRSREAWRGRRTGLETSQCWTLLWCCLPDPPTNLPEYVGNLPHPPVYSTPHHSIISWLLHSEGYVWNIVTSVCLCLSVCLSVCSHNSTTQRSNFKSNFCACCLRLWLSPPLTALRYVTYFWFHGKRHVFRRWQNVTSYVFLSAVGANSALYDWLAAVLFIARRYA